MKDIAQGKKKIGRDVHLEKVTQAYDLQSCAGWYHLAENDYIVKILFNSNNVCE